jgi:hypothetical protein
VVFIAEQVGISELATLVPLRSALLPFLIGGVLAGPLLLPAGLA